MRPGRLSWRLRVRRTCLLIHLELLWLLGKERLRPTAAPAVASTSHAGLALASTGRAFAATGVTRLIWGVRRGMRADVGGQCRSSGHR
jgi:hypothetical protein